MSKQKTFNYKFERVENELNFYTNSTNIDAYNSILKNNNYLYLYGPNKSGKTFLGKIWLNKNNAFEFKNNFEFIIKNKKNVLIDNLLAHDQEYVFHIVNDCILNNLEILIISDLKLNNIVFKYNDLASRLRTFTIL